MVKGPVAAEAAKAQSLSDRQTSRSQIVRTLCSHPLAPLARCTLQPPSVLLEGREKEGPPWHGQVEGMTMSVSKLCGTNETG